MATDANGNVISELRYSACPLRFTSGMLREGEVRYASGVTPTEYQFTGQFSEATFVYDGNGRRVPFRAYMAQTANPSSGSGQAWAVLLKSIGEAIF